MRPADIARELRAADPVLGQVIRRVGVQAPPQSPGGFPALLRAIVFQQISGAAGASILRRVRAEYGGGRTPPARWFLEIPVERLRSAGLSPQKVGYVRDLAGQVASGELRFPELRRRPDAEVLERLTEVRGIGEWTAQMYLLFHLGRPDVLPTGDLGLRKAVQRVYRRRSLPKPDVVERIGRRWSPWRSHATFYLWRSLE
ncbi:MAG: DNA-3-methyladenine glycosylase 2 family protein [Thermoplasmata archaeon]|nr:DNA-3-methyladenine glycosylase 2 family protein [Thermoplasmata archaeon]MCI4341501.1 DNA-3-methyladenine glycosylase 2 family protein [Thermoplasmata archaeon]